MIELFGRIKTVNQSLYAYKLLWIGNLTFFEYEPIRGIFLQNGSHRLTHK
jgi:hypothetical protein